MITAFGVQPKSRDHSIIDDRAAVGGSYSLGLHFFRVPDVPGRLVDEDEWQQDEAQRDSRKSVDKRLFGWPFHAI